MAALGFMGGLPYNLVGFTLRQWMAEGGATLALIGLTANLGLAYTLKFLWAPLLDQLAPPLGLGRFGRRRGWLLAIQPVLALAIAALALSDPAASLAVSMAAAAALALCAATQDIVIDAWRIETFPESMQGAAQAAYVWGYRAAMLLASAGVFLLVQGIGWHGALLAMAALAATAPLITLAAREPVLRGAAVRKAASLALRLRAGIVEPLGDFLTRPHAGPMLAFILLFKLGEALIENMDAPFYRAMGFDRAAIAVALGGPNLVASLAGAAFGGYLVIRLGTGRALVLTGFVQMASIGLYFLLAVSHGAPAILVAKVVLEAFAKSMADAAFITYISALCTPAYTATQFALFTSLEVLAMRTLGGLSGYVAGPLGWIGFYGLGIFAAVPAMLLMLYLLRVYPGRGHAVLVAEG